MIQIVENSFDSFHSIAKTKKVIAFGASKFLQLISLNYKDLKLDQYIDCVVDNDSNKQGKSIILHNCEKNIISPQQLLMFEEENVVILITSDVYVYEIYKQLENMFQGKDIKVFVLSLMIAKHIDDSSEQYLPSINSFKEFKIPKIIHYFWFSKEEKTGLIKECIESWKKVCPDYELKEWNGDNYDVTANAFAYEAYKQKKWAYVSDYARLDVVHKYGGIYLDLDVVLYKNLDILLSQDFFVGFGPIRDIEAAIFGAKQGCSILKEMMQIYDNKKFDVNESMTLFNLQPILLDRFFEKKGFAINGKYQERDGIVIYPRDLFSAKNWFTNAYEMTDVALGIHECAGGWVSSDGKSSKQIKMEGNKKLEEIYKNRMSIKR